MTERQARQIVEAAFKARFSGIDIVDIEIEPGFDFYDEPLLNVWIAYDAELEQLLRGDHMGVRSEIIDKLWYEREDSSPVWPQVHFVARSDYDRRKQAAA